MSYSSQILMPGNFHLDLPSSGGAKGASLSGVHPGLFRPPTSPSVSSSIYLGKSVVSLPSEVTTPVQNAKRKRAGDYLMAADINYDTDMIIDGRSDFDLHANSKESRYVLAGQIETPNGDGRTTYENMDESVYSDIDYRRALGSKRTRDDVNLDNQVSAGWRSFAMNTLGGVMGKVWEFCKAGAFRGFYAGGGGGYQMSELAMQNDVREPSPFYGGFPQSDYSPFHYERETPESTPPPAAKRRQISHGTPTDELRKNWVMIDEPANVSRQPSLASRASSRRPVQRTAAPSLVRRISKPTSRLNAPTLNRHPAARPSGASPGPISSRDQASFASTRSPVAPSLVRAQTPSRIPVPSRPQSPSPFVSDHFLEQPSRIPSPSPYGKRGHRRTQSAISASSVSPIKLKTRESLHEMHDNSPRLDAKARSLAAKRIQDEMETDIRINDFNARLKDMIREGREALGTTFEVESDHEYGRGGGDPWESE
ncbi:hypothetical protein F4777DRAFT_69995 [Nemania sp. FL0916]|nr:hypothetical protein F4777DRAFT_69995 [Nemania sp. FL0916]